MREDSKPTHDDSIIYDESKLYRAVKTAAPAAWLEQDELCWQAQYYDETSLNDDKWERGSYYKTPQNAIEAAKEGKRIDDMLNSLFS